MVKTPGDYTRTQKAYKAHPHTHLAITLVRPYLFGDGLVIFWCRIGDVVVVFGDVLVLFYLGDVWMMFG